MSASVILMSLFLVPSLLLPALISGPYQESPGKPERSSAQAFEAGFSMGCRIHGTYKGASLSECVQKSSGLKFAVKSLQGVPKFMSLHPTTKTAQRELNWEARVLGDISHPNIVKLNNVYLGDGESVKYLVFECPSLGDADSSRARFYESKPKDVFRMSQGLVSAVAFLHSKEIAHCNICLQSILLFSTPSGKILPKLADFGSACIGKQNASYVRKLSIFSPPESISGRGKEGPTFARDVWSLGIVMYILSHKSRHPWQQKSGAYGPRKMENDILEAEIECGKNVLPCLRAALKKMLVRDLAKRIDIMGVEEILRDGGEGEMVSDAVPRETGPDLLQFFQGLFQPCCHS